MFALDGDREITVCIKYISVTISMIIGHIIRHINRPFLMLAPNLPRKTCLIEVWPRTYKHISIRIVFNDQNSEPFYRCIRNVT